MQVFTTVHLLVIQKSTEDWKTAKRLLFLLTVSLTLYIACQCFSIICVEYFHLDSYIWKLI